ncbi:MAG: zinc-ribbon domain-containing protein [Lachnospiraceae bacterium]|nr:zinc-ribbon domain-containing protein [Lachnospiraceae bacterium]
MNCGKELLDGAKFCASCGVAVDVPYKNEKEQRKTVYDGDLHKCPKCGEQLNAFVTICPACNYELRGTQVTSCVHELSLKLEKTETDEQKIELISNFYIPNTKEDIYEFFILAYSNITAGGYGIEAWSVKLEQAYLKAKLAFGNSEEFKYIEELYEKTNKTSARNELLKSKAFKASIVFAVGLLMIIGGLIAAFYQGIGYDDSVPFMLIATIGLIPFIVGLLMLIFPDRQKRRKRSDWQRR